MSTEHASISPAARWWAATTVVGAAVRLAAVPQLQVWHDEIYSLTLVHKPLDEFVSFFAAGGDFHPPLHYLVLRALPGGDETLLRLMNAGLWWAGLALGILWLLRQVEHPGGVNAAYVAIAVAPATVYLGVELRMYGALLALATVLVAAALRATTTQRPLLGGVAVGLLAAAVGFMHYAGIAVALGVLGVLVVMRRRSGAAALVTFCLPWLLYLPALMLHLDKQVPYTTTLSDSLWFASLTAIPLALMVLARPSDSPTSLSLVAGGGAAGLVALAAWRFVAAGNNVLTFGITTALVWLVGLALVGLGGDRSLWVRTTATAAAGAVGMTVVLNPARIEPNRVSTVAAYEELAPARSATVVHVDWAVANEYFASQVDAEVLTVDIPDAAELQDLAASEDDPVLLVSRVGEAMIRRHDLAAEKVVEHVWRLRPTT